MNAPQVVSLCDVTDNRTGFVHLGVKFNSDSLVSLRKNRASFEFESLKKKAGKLPLNSAQQSVHRLNCWNKFRGINFSDSLNLWNKVPGVVSILSVGHPQPHGLSILPEVAACISQWQLATRYFGKQSGAFEGLQTKSNASRERWILIPKPMPNPGKLKDHPFGEGSPVWAKPCALKLYHASRALPRRTCPNVSQPVSLICCSRWGGLTCHRSSERNLEEPEEAPNKSFGEYGCSASGASRSHCSLPPHAPIIVSQCLNAPERSHAPVALHLL